MHFASIYLQHTTLLETDRGISMSDKFACRKKKIPPTPPPGRGVPTWRILGAKIFWALIQIIGDFGPAEGRLVQIIEDFSAGGGIFFDPN